MRVLVTGGAGFIGSHLTDAFLARGDEVIVVDDLSTGRAGRLDEHAGLHKLSITDAVSLGEIVRGTRPELICHLAAHVDVRTSVDAPAAGRPGQRARHGQRAGGGPRDRGPGAVQLLRRHPLRPQRRDPVPGGRAAVARVPGGHRQVLRRAVHRAVQPAARYPALHHAAGQRVRAPPGPQRRRRGHPHLLRRSSWPGKTRRSTAMAHRPATTCTSATRSAPSWPPPTPGAPGPGTSAPGWRSACWTSWRSSAR